MMSRTFSAMKKLLMRKYERELLVGVGRLAASSSRWTISVSGSFDARAVSALTSSVGCAQPVPMKTRPPGWISATAASARHDHLLVLVRQSGS